MKLARRNSGALSRRKNPLSEKQIWNRAMITGLIGGVIGFAIARSSAPPEGSVVRLTIGAVTGVITGMSIGALAFGAKPRQLPRIVFGFPRD